MDVVYQASQRLAESVISKTRGALMTKWEVLEGDNSWSEPLDAEEINNRIRQGTIRLSDEARWVGANFSAPVGRFSGIGDFLYDAAFARHHVALEGFDGSLRLLQFEHELARRAKAAKFAAPQEEAAFPHNSHAESRTVDEPSMRAEELDEVNRDLIPPETKSVPEDQPTSRNLDGSLTGGLLHQGSGLTPDDEALAEQFQELLSRQLEARKTTLLPNEMQEVGPQLADSHDREPGTPFERQLIEAQGTLPSEAPTDDHQGTSVEDSKPLSKPMRTDSAAKPTDTNESAIEMTQWGRVQKYDTKKKKGEVNVDGKMFSFALEDVARLTSPSRVLGSYARVRFAQTPRGFELISLDVQPEHDPEKEGIRQKIAGYRLELEILERKRQGSHGTLLTKWAEINIRDAARDLAEIASRRDESWSFKGRRPHGIAENYLRYTFYRLVYEDKIAFSEDLACFNTGLSDKWNRPIYALFQRYKGKRRPQYRFLEFCIQGEGRRTFNFIHDFPVPPPPAQYVRELHHTFFDGNAEIIIQEEHVIDDGIEAGRYPLKFLERHMPNSMIGRGVPNNRDEAWLKAYVHAINNDEGGQKKRDILAVINHAKDRARARVIQNFKTAIPCYYPDLDTISLLLPLCLLDDHTTDVALVLRYINKSASYGITVYSRELAYINARLVSRPMSEWLNPDIEPSDAGERDLDVGTET
ncbi:hypothetical protein ACVWZM_005277 [Bradyrhizobium sp. USDA 4501]